jgi:hypothetical protein
MLSAGQGLEDEDFIGGGDGIRLPAAIDKWDLIDEDRHMLTDSPLIIEDVRPEFGVRDREPIEHFPNRRPGEVLVGTGEMESQMRGEPNHRHGGDRMSFTRGETRGT